MNSTFSNQGTNILGGTSVTTLNSLDVAYGDTGGRKRSYNSCWSNRSILGSPRRSTRSAAWWNVVPNATLNMNNNGITNLPSINGTQINLNSTYDFIGIGRGALDWKYRRFSISLLLV